MELRTDDGLRLNYQVVGHGQSLVFIHGFGGYQQVWTRQVEYFTSHGYQVVTYDQRNHDASQFDPNLDSIHRLSRDLQELLALPTINHPILIGHSMGASVIYDFLTRYPNYPLAGVVAVD
ncbi:alpha/beta fold hydrolase [Limosilactobacillus fermentum]|nr:alpha/beta hydrolase [Limosilactobacillus fermentum]